MLRFIVKRAGQFTWDPDNISPDVVLSNNNLTMTSLADGIDITGISIEYVTTGKWYWEIHLDDVYVGNYISFGVGLADVDFTNTTRSGWLESWAWMGNGRYYHDGAYVGAPTYGELDNLMFALDADLGRMWYGEGGVWNGSGDPANNLNPVVDDATMIGQNIYVVGTLRRPDDQITLAPTSNSFLYSVPNGFSAIGTS